MQRRARRLLRVAVTHRRPTTRPVLARSTRKVAVARSESTNVTRVPTLTAARAVGPERAARNTLDDSSSDETFGLTRSMVTAVLNGPATLVVPPGAGPPAPEPLVAAAGGGGGAATGVPFGVPRPVGPS